MVQILKIHRLQLSSTQEINKKIYFVGVKSFIVRSITLLVLLYK